MLGTHQTQTVNTYTGAIGTFFRRGMTCLFYLPATSELTLLVPFVQPSFGARECSLHKPQSDK